MWQRTFQQHIKFEFNWPIGVSGKDVFKCWLTADGSWLTLLNDLFLLVCLIPCLQMQLVRFSQGTCLKTINSNVKVSILSFMQLLEHWVIIRAVRYDSKVMTRIFPTMLHISGRKLYSETWLKRPLENRQTNVLKISGNLVQAKGIAEGSTGAFCNTFDLH